MGLGHFLDSVDKSLQNVGRAGEFAVKHPGKVISGAAKVGEFALEHPGEVGKLAGKSLVHSLTDPKELLINAALIAGTMGTGFAAKEAAELGVETTAKVAGEVIEKTAAKTGEEVATKTAAKATEETAGKVAEETAAKTGGRSVEQKILESGRRNPVSRAITEQRTNLAQNFLARGGENPSALRQAGAAVIQGTSGTMPTQLEGMSDTAYSLQKNAWRATQINKRVGQAQMVGKGVEATAHPYQTALNVASGGGGGRGGGGGETPVSQSAPEPERQPGTAIEPYRQPGAMQPLSQPVNNSYTPGRGFSQPQPTASVNGQPLHMQQTGPGTWSGSGSYPGMPSSSTTAPPASSAPSPSLAYRAGRGFAKVPGLTAAGAYLNSPKVLNPSKQRFWQGPHREMFGGIEPDYDWRKGYENRPMDARKPKLRKMGAPEEAKKPGAYETPSGQEPQGALNPGAPKMTALGTGDQRELGAGPNVNFGGPGPFKMGSPAAITMGGRKASFYAGSGEYTPQKSNTGIIDADSHSPDDYKFEPGGQGYLDFPDMPRSPLTQPKPKATLGV